MHLSNSENGYPSDSEPKLTKQIELCFLKLLKLKKKYIYIHFFLNFALGAEIQPCSEILSISTRYHCRIQKIATSQLLSQNSKNQKQQFLKFLNLKRIKCLQLFNFAEIQPIQPLGSSHRPNFFNWLYLSPRQN